MRALPGKLTFWRRRAVAGLTVVAVGAGLWVALADGTATERGDASDLTASRMAGERLVAGFDGRRPPRALKRMIRDGRLAGVILFSGSLYLLAVTDVKVLGAITPLGGLCFLVGWAALAWGVWRGSPPV